MKSVLMYGISGLPSVVLNDALAEPGAAVAAVRDRVERLDELVALAVLPERLRPGQRAVHGVRRPRMQPDRDALPDVRHLLVRAVAAGDEERDPDDDEREARRRDVEHREEDPVVEKRRAEVVRRDEHEHAAAPDDEQRPDVLEPRLRERLALLAQVGGEEDDQEDLRELARLELDRADAHPEPCAVDRRAEPGHARQEQQRDRRDPEQVLVVLELAVVAAQPEQREREEADADDDPEPLLERVVGTEPVDLGHADRRQHTRHRQQVRVGVRRPRSARRGAPRRTARRRRARSRASPS